MKLKFGFVCAVAASAIAGAARAADIVLEDDLVVGDFAARLTDNYSGTGGIVVTAPFGTNLVSFTGFVRKTAAESTMVISNAWYLDVIPVSAKTGGGIINDNQDWIACHRKEPVWGVDKKQRVTYQLHSRDYSSSTHVKVVKIAIEQQGCDVVIFAIDTYYFETKDAEGKTALEIANELMGVFDMDNPSQWDYCKTRGWTSTLATSGSESGYGVKDPTFAVRCQAGLVVVDGVLEYSSSPTEKGGSLKKVVEGLPASQVDILSALSAGPAATAGYVLYPFFEHVEGNDRRVQFQFSDQQHVKAVNVQWGAYGTADLYVWNPKAFYNSFADHPEAVSKLGTYELTTGSNPSAYLVSDIYFRVNSRTAVLSGSNTYEGVTLVDGPATLTCKGDDRVLPAGARIVVTNGATLVFDAKVEKPISLAYNECGIGQTDRTKGIAIEVAKDSVFRVSGDWNVNDLATVVIDGGRFEPNKQTIYMPNLTLLNGGIAEGTAMFRMGASANSFLLSGGEAGCTNEVRSDVRHYNRGEQLGNPWTITTDADLLFSGAILYGTDNGWHGREIVKDGAASLILANANSHRSSVTVEEGTLVLAHEEAMTTNMPLVIDGGTVTVAAGVTNEVKSISPGAKGGRIVLEADAVLKTDAWGDFADGATLKVSAADGAKFYVPRLTSAARAALRWDDGTPEGQCVHRAPDGSLAPGSVGLLILFR